jgi:SAM-dependent methyltransferase
MITIINFLIIILLYFGLLIAVVFLFSFIWTSLFVRYPFVPVPMAIIPEIIKCLKIEDGSRVYDLGCGDGRVLSACLKASSAADYIGIERDFMPFLLAKIKLFLSCDSKKIKLLRKNFFHCDLSGANRIFLYLYPGLIEKLLPKLEKELAPGARLVSCDLPLPGKETTEIIELSGNKNFLVKKLFVYTF